MSGKLTKAQVQQNLLLIYGPGGSTHPPSYKGEHSHTMFSIIIKNFFFIFTCIPGLGLKLTHFYFIVTWGHAI